MATNSLVWSKLTAAQRSKLGTLDAIFIPAPRDMSRERLVQIIKRYLPKAPIIFGVTRELYVAGFDGQPQFAMLRPELVTTLAGSLARSDTPHSFVTLEYEQSQLEDIVSTLDITRVLLVNGSWHYVFHNSAASKVLKARRVPYKFISPFVSEDEARAYEQTHTPDVVLPSVGTRMNSAELFDLADRVAVQSYDYSFQTGAVLAREVDGGYEFIAAGFNEVIPYQTYALHHGNSRERHESPPHDTNHYDTIHAEMQLLAHASRGEFALDGATLAINLLPCPNCARTLSQTGIATVLYRRDHSDGYAKQLLEQCGKKVQQIP